MAETFQNLLLGFSVASYFVFATWLRVPLPASPWGF